MPLTRYEIGNEYSLADPELYRAADKDDPEALLEGVAMAGLVGVLRQLGDLAEFAAEIFHDLHEELMATAARGHGLTVRVQQIESEFPSIEKAFLSQTNHSSFYYNNGVDWHPNVHMDQSLVTQGDLPRFVMDSYEECRGPPRLFLLDKFDVAGAGSCLKRYTDPSFFKTESPLSVTPNAEVQREKKSRKSKKKGSRWTNRETPEATSRVKLQQLFLEERVENHISDPARRVKLKRRINGSPFGSTTGKSYMDAILKIPASDSDIVREIPIKSSPLKKAASIDGEISNEVLDITEISSNKITEQRKRSMYSSSDSEAGYKPSNHELTNEDYGISPKLSLNETNDVLSTLYEVDKKEIIAEEVRIRKINGYQSDDEIDNYVDALATMDSEIETDNEFKTKNEMHLLNVDGSRLGSDATEELYDIQTRSTDTQSIGNSSLMDGGNSSSRNEKSIFSYSGYSDLAENAPSKGDALATNTLSAEHREAEIVNSLSDNACNENANISSYKNEIEGPCSSSCVTESGLVLLPGDPEVSSLGPELDEISSNHSNNNAGNANNADNSIYLGKNIRWISNHDNQPSQTEDDGFSKLSSNSIDELNDQDTFASDNDSNGNSRNNVATIFNFGKEKISEPENEACSPRVNPENNDSEAGSRFDIMLDKSETTDPVEMKLRNSENDQALMLKLDVDSSSEGDSEEMGGLSSDNNLVQKDDNDINFATQVKRFPDYPDIVDLSEDDEMKENNHLQGKDVVTAIANANLDLISMNLQKECSFVLQDLPQNDMKFNEELIRESSTNNIDNEQADVTSETESISSKILPCNDSDLVFLHRVSDSSTSENFRNSLKAYKNNAGGMSSFNDLEDAESKSIQKINSSDKEEEAQFSPTHDLVEIYNGQLDVESWHDHISELKSSQLTDVVDNTENILSSPTNHLAELSSHLDQKVELQSENLDFKSRHETDGQVFESKYCHQTDALEEEKEEEEDKKIPLDDNFELYKNQFDSESRYVQVSRSTSVQHIDFENVEDLIFSLTHQKEEINVISEQKNESLNDRLAVEPSQPQDSESESFQHIITNEKLEDNESLLTVHETELNLSVELKDEFQNNHFDVKSWHDQNSDLENSQNIEVTESSETAVSSETCFVEDLITPIDQTLELKDNFDENYKPANNTKTDSSPIQQGESSTPNDQERERYPSSGNLSQILPQFSATNPIEDPLRSNFSIFGVLPKASLDETPPLPPLPPMQWRLGKAQQNFPAPDGNFAGQNIISFPPFISTTEDKPQLGHTATSAENSYPSNPFLEDDSSQDINVNPLGYVVDSAAPLSQQVPSLVLPMDHSVECEDVLINSERGKFQDNANQISPLTSVEDKPSALSSCSLSEKTINSIYQSASSTSSGLDDNIQEDAIFSEEKNPNLPSTIKLQPIVHEYEKQPVLSTSEDQATWTSTSSLSVASPEEGMMNGNKKFKLPRPRNPLIDAVVAHDKSKLRKVTRLPQSQIGQKAEERDTLLEQIRAKSFSLKPAVVTRPSIQGPATNLRLAAILEKANAIRQAFAGTGSDEDDDDDGWSDS